MRSKLSLNAVLLALVFASGGTFAGGASGGGGVGVLCHTDNGTELSTLDVYEAEYVYKFGKPFNFGSVSKNIVEWESRSLIANGIEPNPSVLEIEKNILGTFIPVKKLELTNDFTKRPLKVGCEYIQIAKYIDPPINTRPEDIWKFSKIEIVIDLYDKLDEVSKAALIVHEHWYFVNRWTSFSQNLAYGSDEIRILNAAIMTNKHHLVIPARLKFAKGSMFCQFDPHDRSSVESYKYWTKLDAREEIFNGVQGIRFYAGITNGYLPLIRTTAFVPGLSVQQLLNGDIENPIDLELKADIELPSVITKSYKIRLEKSRKDYKLQVRPMYDASKISYGSCVQMHSN